MSWHIGDRVDGYELRAELGRGGMGVVYQGLRIETGSTVAIKTLHIQDPEELLRFEREGVALARLRHPNLIRVHAAGRHEGCPYLVLQHAGGGSLADRLTQGPLPWEAATALVEQLAAGLEVAHAHGILHRDLKPANVLFSRDEIPLLADFGLAKVSDLSRLTETGTVLGSPLFMAPEQARGEDSGPAADVYGLGAILFVCLSGEPPIPFRGTVMAQLISLQEETPRRLGPPTPSWLAELVSRALAGDPKARPSLAELRASLAGTGLPKRPARWGRLIVGALAGSSLLAFGLFGPPLTRQGNPTPSRPSSPHPATSPAPTPARTSVPQFSELEVLIPRWISRPESVKALKAARARLSAAATPKARREVEAKLAEAANAERSHDQEVARVALLELRYLGWLGPICAELVDFDAEERGFLQHAGDFGYGKAHDVLGGRMERRRSRSVGVAHRFLSLAQSFHPRREDLKPHWDEFKTVYADDLPRSAGEALVRVYKARRLLQAERDARRFLETGDPASALVLFRAAFAADPDSEPLRLAISHSAELHWTSELRGRAWPYTRGREPQTPTALPELRAEADALLRQLEWPQGHYLRAVMEAPTASPFRDAKGKLSRIDPKRLPTMRKHLERALELDHGLLPARLLLALVRLRGRDLKGALLELDRATPLAPGSNVQSKNLKAYYALEPLGR